MLGKVEMEDWGGGKGAGDLFTCQLPGEGQTCQGKHGRCPLRERPFIHRNPCLCKALSCYSIHPVDSTMTTEKGCLPVHNLATVESQQMSQPPPRKPPSTKPGENGNRAITIPSRLLPRRNIPFLCLTITMNAMPCPHTFPSCPSFSPTCSPVPPLLLPNRAE